MSIFYRILFIIIAICIPVITVFGAMNIVYRMPDLYVYEFNNNEIANEIDLGIKDDELGQFFSDFMTGKEKEFDLFTEYRDREQSVFGTGEQINMENARKLLNHTLYIIGIALILAVISYGVFLLKKKKYELRIAFKTSIIVFAVMQAVFYILFLIEKTREFLYEMIFINPFGADDALPLMLTERFAKISVIANSVVALIMLIILASITWRITKPRRMFWQ
ncbi:MAG: DUF1461 domain-containing protein [Bacillota bacterium]